MGGGQASRGTPWFFWAWRCPSHPACHGTERPLQNRTAWGDWVL